LIEKTPNKSMGSTVTSNILSSSTSFTDTERKNLMIITRVNLTKQNREERNVCHMEIIVSKITEKVVIIVTVEEIGTVTAAMTDVLTHKAYDVQHRYHGLCV
jgi:hypothetical protein